MCHQNSVLVSWYWLSKPLGHCWRDGPTSLLRHCVMWCFDGPIERCWTCWSKDDHRCQTIHWPIMSCEQRRYILEKNVLIRKDVLHHIMKVVTDNLVLICSAGRRLFLKKFSFTLLPVFAYMLLSQSLQLVKKWTLPGSVEWIAGHQAEMSSVWQWIIFFKELSPMEWGRTQKLPFGIRQKHDMLSGDFVAATFHLTLAAYAF